MAASPEISLAIVSHRQLALVEQALTSLARTPPRLSFEVVLVENVPSAASVGDRIAGIPVRTLVNSERVGLACNLNRAIRETQGDLLCIANPDVVFLEDVISPLAEMVRSGQADIAAPTIVDARGQVLESARGVPRPLELVGRRLRTGPPAARLSTDGEEPAWLAGTFLLMRRETFQALSGFDEGYYLYFEDVDFGCRARLAGFQLLRHPGLRLQHQPALRSRSHPRYFAWHLASALRFFISPTYRAALKWERGTP